MNFIDICSGIGGFRSALENNGHNCLAFAEIDKYAKQSYRAIYDTEGEDELDDITAITDEHFRLYRGQCDIITGGFPCQAFSIAGNRRGFDDTRGTIFFHIARAIKEIQPSYVLLENVKGLFSHDKGRTFGTIIQALDELGYITEWGLFNSKYWGVPQNRERVYILVTRKDVYDQPKLFDLLKQQKEVTTRLVDVLEDEVDEKYYLHSDKAYQLIRMIGDEHEVNNKIVVDASVNDPKIKEVMNTVTSRYDSGIQNHKSIGGVVIEPKIAVPVLTPDRLNKRQNGRRFKEDGEPMFTLTSQDRHGIAIREATKQGYAVAEQGDSVNVSYPTSKTRRGRVGKQVAQTLQAGEVNQGVVMNNLRIRKLTPLECWRLQGFTDEQFYKAKESGVSNSQLYKQAGNSVSVPVVDAIVKCL
ncbi:DNA (cytosine-5-)-methyltransferase [Staphylococcus saprophyticus]|nr:DNA (cytosine-5-)-methyltransferase [Staphylococcus saprophyticus]